MRYLEKVKNLNYIGIIGILIICMLSGCANVAGRRQFVSNDKLKIVTTIYPIQNFVEEIAGEKAEVVNLVPAGIEPHDFELSVGDMQLIEEADFFIYNGAGMEHFVDKTLASIRNSDLQVIEAAKNIQLLSADDSVYHADPHTWLSISNVIAQVEYIKDRLCDVDAQNAQYYEQNCLSYIERLQQLQRKYQDELKEISQHKIVVAHEAFGYLCEEYGLVQEAVEGLTADSEPDSARMKEIVEFCKENEIQVIFFEELVSPKIAQTIADEVGARTEVLNPIEGRTASQEQEGLDYIGMMEQNLIALKNALK